MQAEFRPAAVAGAFYPGDAAALRTQVRKMLTPCPATVAGPPKAIIAPHAGYIYSGATAGTVFGELVPWCDRIERVVLLGPTHRVAVRGLAIPSTTGFLTPLGAIPVDRAAIADISGLPQVVVSDLAHAQEHSLEVHLPFLQEVLGSFTLVPLAVGHASPQAVAEVLERLWGGPETLIVISSDLSHYLPYGTAREIDAATCQRIFHLDIDIGTEEACGAYPINGLLLVARRLGLRPRLVASCNSGDTAGDRSRVVGYAAFAFDEPERHHG